VDCRERSHGDIDSARKKLSMEAVELSVSIYGRLIVL